MNNCHYCNDEDCPELNWVYGLDHILPDYKFCPMCGRRMDRGKGGNDSLTLDELGELDGCPVWIVNDNRMVKCALVCSYCSAIYLTFGDGTRLDVKDVLDNGCKIYRDRPEWCD